TDSNKHLDRPAKMFVGKPDFLLDAVQGTAVVQLARSVRRWQATLLNKARDGGLQFEATTEISQFDVEYAATKAGNVPAYAGHA
ncbi:hypothetical protein, partial [Paraburkholderia sp. UYCP14C]|uniref:hypothetical protein n=1 Tax=Paraburkholderia sp. UYCP14C TaxID=2511130 RepID=UPI00145A00F9